MIYLNDGADGDGEVPVPIAPGSNASVKANADVRTKGWVLNVVGGYNLRQAEPGSDVVSRDTALMSARRYEKEAEQQVAGSDKGCVL